MDPLYAPGREPLPEDFVPRTAHDPADVLPVRYDWDDGLRAAQGLGPAYCRSCAFWNPDGNPQYHRLSCPRVPLRPGSAAADWSRLACLATNRPGARHNVKYWRPLRYGNEED